MKLKFDRRVLKTPSAFNIKKTDSIKKIDEMQIELKNTINELQKLYDAIHLWKKEKEKTNEVFKLE